MERELDPMQDRRAHPRTLLPIRPRIMFACLEDAGGGHCTEISLGGMLIATDEAAFAWMGKQVVLHMPKVGVVAEGRVVRYDPGTSIAVMFEDVGDQAALARLCGGGA
jgi:hypothetical protein